MNTKKGTFGGNASIIYKIKENLRNIKIIFTKFQFSKIIYPFILSHKTSQPYMPYIKYKI